MNDIYELIILEKKGLQNRTLRHTAELIFETQTNNQAINNKDNLR